MFEKVLIIRVSETNSGFTVWYIRICLNKFWLSEFLRQIVDLLYEIFYEGVKVLIIRVSETNSVFTVCNISIWGWKDTNYCICCDTNSCDIALLLSLIDTY